MTRDDYKALKDVLKAQIGKSRNYKTFLEEADDAYHAGLAEDVKRIAAELEHDMREDCDCETCTEVKRIKERYQ